MLHTSSPAAFIATEKLAESAKCPDCGASSILAAASSTSALQLRRRTSRRAHLDMFRQMLPVVGAPQFHGPRIGGGLATATEGSSACGGRSSLRKRAVRPSGAR